MNLSVAGKFSDSVPQHASRTPLNLFLSTKPSRLVSPSFRSSNHLSDIPTFGHVKPNKQKKNVGRVSLLLTVAVALHMVSDMAVLGFNLPHIGLGKILQGDFSHLNGHTIGHLVMSGTVGLGIALQATLWGAKKWGQKGTVTKGEFVSAFNELADASDINWRLKVNNKKDAKNKFEYPKHFLKDLGACLDSYYKKERKIENEKLALLKKKPKNRIEMLGQWQQALDSLDMNQREVRNDFYEHIAPMVMAQGLNLFEVEPKHETKLAKV
jgi:hypothetical protein